MVESVMRPTVIELSLSAIKDNIETIRTATHVQNFWAVVKANAYGHGLVPMVNGLRQAHVDGFSVATLDEALVVRQVEPELPILVLALVEPKYAQIMADNQIMATVGTLAWLNSAQTYLHETALQVSLGLDTGMGRIGFDDRHELDAAIEFIEKNSAQFEWTSLHTHFSTADSPDFAYFAMQLQRWNKLTAGLAFPKYVHVANSGAALYHHDEITMQTARIGALMYGWDPSMGDLQPKLDLQPVLALRSQLMNVKQHTAVDGVSYGHHYFTQPGEWIGTVPIGYADGLPKQLTGMRVLVGGEQATIVGDIAMDQLMISLPHEFAVGTPVIFLGHDGTQAITIEEWTAKTGLDPWDITTGFTDRITRRLVN
ncbi:alanine racemase [Periweissella cryptocerci]|uniref:Alanine racemase n=1 Tax=Periweissella cryptocerci TaxID=2506420 RepID=A0A4P6YUN8_9LACO|nr:alanine racemase [Periweissella cryptocerci]QBO36509.1 alanine racemase [Periweissella cryptocerci]